MAFWTCDWNKMIPTGGRRPWAPKVSGEQVQSEWRPSEPPLGCFRVPFCWSVGLGGPIKNLGISIWLSKVRHLTCPVSRKQATDRSRKIPASQDTCHQRHELAPLLSRDSGDADGDACAGSNLVCVWVGLLFWTRWENNGKYGKLM